MSTTAPRPISAQNGVLLEQRQAKGWGRGRLAAEFERIGRELGLSVPSRAAMEKAIYRHETGASHVTDEIYVRLYCGAFECSPHELFGGLTDSREPGEAEFHLSSNKFSPVYVGPDVVAQLATTLPVQQTVVEQVECWAIKVDHPRGECTPYGFPWGCLVYHIQEPLSKESVADVAVWRHGSYPRELDWAEQHARSLLGPSQSGPEYIFSAFWVDTLKWKGDQLVTAMRLLCAQKTLLDHGEEEPSRSHAELVEQAFMRDGFSDPRIYEFGVSGISYGYASWSSVSYHPLEGRRGLPQQAIVDFEIIVQSLWCFCHHIRSQIEDGRDPEVAPGFDWRWLRGMTSRLTNSRPRESAQHVAMRITILESSGLQNHLNDTIEILKDSAERQQRDPR
ncbi:hypothetical protein ACGFIF_33910 [Kribbella sp. NPDC049174]|uniref:hypothetical protein n=1 Tax=Kribbella sp. NPDC049174 TaxID=3364112 RepID=UPI00371FBEF2